MKPSYSQLVCWCAIHRIELQQRTHLCSLIARDDQGGVITYVDVRERWEEDKEADPRVAKGCARIALECAIVPPQEAVVLNHSSYR